MNTQLTPGDPRLSVAGQPAEQLPVAQPQTEGALAQGAETLPVIDPAASVEAAKTPTLPQETQQEARPAEGTSSAGATPVEQQSTAVPSGHASAETLAASREAEQLLKIVPDVADKAVSNEVPTTESAAMAQLDEMLDGGNFGDAEILLGSAPEQSENS